ncbi:MAG: hypothetical protein WCQ69_03880 [Bacteroidales bacterium]
MYHKYLDRILTAAAVLILSLHGCSGNPSKFVDNVYVGTWHIDTSRVRVSVSVDAGDASNLQVFMPFITNNYQHIRTLLKDPHTIRVAGSSRDDPYSGTYSLLFSSGNVYTSSYKLVRNILFLTLSDKSGNTYTIPCQADGNTLQIVYSTPYMRALILDFIEDNFPEQAQDLISIILSITVTLEGLSVYNTRTRDLAGQYGQP